MNNAIYLAGDFSGIQRYVLGMKSASPAQAKRLRARSFPCPELDNVPEADGFISLSTFQPEANDPVEGFWKLFAKLGENYSECFSGSTA